MKYNFRRANYPLMHDMLPNTDWSCLKDFSDVNAACDQFYVILNEIFKTCVPMFKNSKHKYPPWFNFEIRNNLRMKNLAHKNYKKYNAVNYLNEYKSFSTLVVKLIRHIKSTLHFWKIQFKMILLSFGLLFSTNSIKLGSQALSTGVT